MSGFGDFCAIAAVCALCASLCIVMKKHSPEQAFFTALTCGAVVFFALVPTVSALADEFSKLSMTAQIEEFECVLKAVGICLIAQFAADACTDAGQQSLAVKVQLAGKLATFALAMPLLKQLAALVGSLIDL
ncbi:MAG: SpoIIIAC/SpoIIIAD family protein [Oscillospiraceae bacterium]